MHRTEADGNATGLYTEGDAGLGVAATVFSSAAANSFQEEIAQVVEGAGLTLLTKSNDNFAQLLAAVKILISNGGSVSPIIQTLVNDSVQLDVENAGVDIEFDRTVIKSASYDYVIIRNTDSFAKVQEGTISVIYEPKNQVWKIATDSTFDDVGVQFNLLVGSTANKQKLVYTTDDLTGTSYSGELTLTNYKEKRV